ncbi:F0F1 ATP synthase subunit B [Alkalilacustris brevis]|uniref:F0F1 ATP synthase subunit B n=1 Tax=Alkalilacustris brevis TaxID=2026338 RepID=UPI000E0DADEE|nr:F0F1 ATP synthase subunit B [Alkalilacustris brevis]
MRKALIALALISGATPALAAAGDYPFFSLYNTDIVVAIAFVLFVGILVYYKVPAIITGMLDKRADAIRADLDEARALREEAQQVLASYERKQREVEDQAKRIVENARREAEEAAEQARADIETSFQRRVKAAEDQIASAEAEALRSVRNRAVEVAVAASGELITKQMKAADANRLVDDGIGVIEQKLH